MKPSQRQPTSAPTLFVVTNSYPCPCGGVYGWGLAGGRRRFAHSAPPCAPFTQGTATHFLFVCAGIHGELDALEAASAQRN